MQRNTLSTMSLALPVLFIVAFMIQPGVGQSNDDDSSKSNDEKTVQFLFQESDWKDVIPWFAEQAGYSLQTINEWPDDTFYLIDDSEYTVIQALDQLNYSLRMRKQPFTLIRNRKMLILSRLEDAQLPDDLIETVSVEDLDKRGKHEALKCNFQLSDMLNAEDMFAEIEPILDEKSGSISRGSVFPQANQIRIRAMGGQLRDIRSLLETAEKRALSGNLNNKTYRLRHMDAETFMIISRPMLTMDTGQDTTENGDLMISRQPLGDLLYLRGTNEKLNLFQEIADLVDAPSEEVEGPEVAKQYFHTYQIMFDPKLANDLLDTILDGTSARKQQDETTGAILVQGNAADHKRVEEALAEASGQTSADFDIIKVNQGDATEIALAIEGLLGRSSLDTETKGPVILSNSLMNQILVKGTPQEVAQIRRMAKELDANSVPPITGPRTNTRIISMDENDKEDLFPMLEDLLKQTGRTNPFNMVLPEERKDLRSQMRGLDENSGSSLNPNILRRSSEWFQSSAAMVAYSTGLNAIPTSLVSFPSFPVQEQELGQTTDESAKQRSGYSAPPQLPSLPGAPITVESTEYGIVLRSDDFDALDDLVYEIDQLLGTDSSVQKPTFFFLKHREASIMMSQLEQFFGLADSSGGGGGNPMAGMMDNMLGGGTGGMLDSLLGGGGGGGAGGGAELEGEVKFNMDVKFNVIFVTGATRSDLDQISDFLDVFDQADPPQDIELVGDFYTIPVRFIDPTELKTMIEGQLPGLLDSGKDDGGGAKQNNDAANMMKMMQAAMGGKGGKRGGSDPEEEKPKAFLGVDTINSQLLVTGPHAIYLEVLKRVELLDIEQPIPSMESYKFRGNQENLKATLKQMFGDRFEVLTPGEESEEGSGTNGSGGSGGSTKAASAAAKANADRSAAIQNMMRAAAARGGGGGTATRAGGTRGGGGGGNRGGGGGGRGR